MSNGNIGAILSDRAQKDLAEAIGCRLSIPVFDYESSVFDSTEELAVHTSRSFKGQVVAVVASLRPNLHQSIFEHFLVLSALKTGGAARIISVLPFLPYSRSDKQFYAHGTVGVSVMLNLLETAGADQVVTVDLHGNTASTQPLVHDIDATPAIVQQVRKWQKPNTILVAEDAGALPRVIAIAKETNLPYMSFSKQRKGDDKVGLSSDSAVPLSGFHAIIVDDAVYTAATIGEACQSLRKMGASMIDVVVTHAMLTKAGRKRLEEAGISKIAVSDSLPSNVRNILYAQVVSVAEPIALALKRLS